MLHIDGMDVLSEGKDREGHVEAVASEPAHIKLTQPIEEGGMSMIQFAAAMKKDAQDQNRLVKIIWSLVSETVERNDSRKVSRLLSHNTCQLWCQGKRSGYADALRRRQLIIFDAEGVEVSHV